MISFEEYHAQQEAARKESSIDLEAMQAGADQKEKEAAESFNKWLDDLGEQKRKAQDRLSYEMLQADEKDSDRKRREMEAKIAEESATAADSIRAKYESDSPADWNDSELTKAYKDMAKNL